jgi:hypothetical protein
VKGSLQIDAGTIVHRFRESGNAEPVRLPEFLEQAIVRSGGSGVIMDEPVAATAGRLELHGNQY